MTNQDIKNPDSSQYKECPKLKFPDGVNVPANSDKEFEDYKNIQKGKKQAIDEVKTTAYRNAKKALDDIMLTSQFVLDTAESAFNLAGKKYNSDVQGEQTRVSFEINTYYDEYNKKLQDDSNAIPCHTKNDSTKDLPDYIKAVAITEFHQKIAELTIDHQNKLKIIEKVLFDATKVWKQAKIEFDYAKCDAEAQEVKSQRDADLAWRTSLKNEVDAAASKA
jgi:hypothetical protein